MKKPLLTSALLTLASSTFAVTAKIDFGTDDYAGVAMQQVTLNGGVSINAGVGTSANWNLNGGASVAAVGLLDTTGAATGWTLDATVSSVANGTDPEFVLAGAGGIYSGALPALADAAFGTTAGGDGAYQGLLVQNGSAMKFTLSGLTDALSYDLSGWAGRTQNQANTLASFTLTTGVAAASFFQNVAGTVTPTELVGVNTSNGNAQAFGWSGVQSVGGVIEFTMASGAATSANLVDLQALSVTAVPEPSTYGLMGAGALAVAAALRRRRK